MTFENFNRLFYLYGTNIDHITEKAYEYYQENKDTRICWLKAEIWYAVNYEMTTNLCDFFIRRNEIFYFERNEIPPILDIVTDEMAILLSWTPEQKNRSKADFMKEYEQAVTIK
ncbi:MAG: hypothetical protein HY738_15685 [Bacteroidia bacterium]|nr:hypothetical protein [Bacteroidia bacterium]